MRNNISPRNAVGSQERELQLACLWHAHSALRGAHFTRVVTYGYTRRLGEQVRHVIEGESAAEVLAYMSKQFPGEDIEGLRLHGRNGVAVTFSARPGMFGIERSKDDQQPWNEIALPRAMTGGENQ